MICDSEHLLNACFTDSSIRDWTIAPDFMIALLRKTLYSPDIEDSLMLIHCPHSSFLTALK